MSTLSTTHEPTASSLGERLSEFLRKYREKDRERTQLWLSKKLKVSRATVIRWEKKGGGNVTLDELQRICALTKTSLQDLLGLSQDHLGKEPSNTDLLQEIRSLRAPAPSDPFIIAALAILPRIDKTKHARALASLRTFADSQDVVTKSDEVG